MSDFMDAIRKEVHWWPPKVGDVLRKHELFTDAKRSREENAVIVKHVAAKVHVVSAFDHDGETWIVGALWFPGRQRWSYQTYGIIEASSGGLWRDGDRAPRGGLEPQ